MELEKAVGVPIIIIDQTDLHSQLQGLCDKAIGIQGGAYSTGQLKSYMRTPVGFYIAQLLTQDGFPAIVLGTGNRDEDI